MADVVHVVTRVVCLLRECVFLVVVLCAAAAFADVLWGTTTTANPTMVLAASSSGAPTTQQATQYPPHNKVTPSCSADQTTPTTTDSDGDTFITPDDDEDDIDVVESIALARDARAKYEAQNLAAPLTHLDTILAGGSDDNDSKYHHHSVADAILQATSTIPEDEGEDWAWSEEESSDDAVRAHIHARVASYHVSASSSSKRTDVSDVASPLPTPSEKNKAVPPTTTAFGWPSSPISFAEAAPGKGAKQKRKTATTTTTSSSSVPITHTPVVIADKSSKVELHDLNIVEVAAAVDAAESKQQQPQFKSPEPPHAPSPFAISDRGYTPLTPLGVALHNHLGGDRFRKATPLRVSFDLDHLDAPGAGGYTFSYSSNGSDTVHTGPLDVEREFGYIPLSKSTNSSTSLENFDFPFENDPSVPPKLWLDTSDDLMTPVEIPDFLPFERMEPKWRDVAMQRREISRHISVPRPFRHLIHVITQSHDSTIFVPVHGTFSFMFKIVMPLSTRTSLHPSCEKSPFVDIKSIVEDETRTPLATTLSINMPDSDIPLPPNVQLADVAFGVRISPQRLWTEGVSFAETDGVLKAYKPILRADSGNGERVVERQRMVIHIRFMVDGLLEITVPVRIWVVPNMFGIHLDRIGDYIDMYPGDSYTEVLAVRNPSITDPLQINSFRSNNVPMTIMVLSEKEQVEETRQNWRFPIAQRIILDGNVERKVRPTFPAAARQLPLPVNPVTRQPVQLSPEGIIMDSGAGSALDAPNTVMLLSTAIPLETTNTQIKGSLMILTSMGNFILSLTFRIHSRVVATKELGIFTLPSIPKHQPHQGDDASINQQPLHTPIQRFLIGVPPAPSSSASRPCLDAFTCAVWGGAGDTTAPIRIVDAYLRLRPPLSTAAATANLGHADHIVSGNTVGGGAYEELGATPNSQHDTRLNGFIERTVVLLRDGEIGLERASHVLSILLLQSRSVYQSRVGSMGMMRNAGDIVNDTSPFGLPASMDRHPEYGMESGSYLSSVERFLQMASQIATHTVATRHATPEGSKGTFGLGITDKAFAAAMPTPILWYRHHGVGVYNDAFTSKLAINDGEEESSGEDVLSSSSSGSRPSPFADVFQFEKFISGDEQAEWDVPRTTTTNTTSSKTTKAPRSGSIAWWSDEMRALSSLYGGGGSSTTSSADVDDGVVSNQTHHHEEEAKRLIAALSSRHALQLSRNGGDPHSMAYTVLPCISVNPFINRIISSSSSPSSTTSNSPPTSSSSTCEKDGHTGGDAIGEDTPVAEILVNVSACSMAMEAEGLMDYLRLQAELVIELERDPRAVSPHPVHDGATVTTVPTTAVGVGTVGVGPSASPIPFGPQVPAVSSSGLLDGVSLHSHAAANIASIIDKKEEPYHGPGMATTRPIATPPSRCEKAGFAVNREANPSRRTLSVMITGTVLNAVLTATPPPTPSLTSKSSTKKHSPSSISQHAAIATIALNVHDRAATASTFTMKRTSMSALPGWSDNTPATVGIVGAGGVALVSSQESSKGTIPLSDFIEQLSTPKIHKLVSNLINHAKLEWLLDVIGARSDIVETSHENKEPKEQANMVLRSLVGAMTPQRRGDSKKNIRKASDALATLLKSFRGKDNTTTSTTPVNSTVLMQRYEEWLQAMVQVLSQQQTGSGSDYNATFFTSLPESPWSVSLRVFDGFATEVSATIEGRPSIVQQKYGRPAVHVPATLALDSLEVSEQLRQENILAAASSPSHLSTAATVYPTFLINELQQTHIYRLPGNSLSLRSSRNSGYPLALDHRQAPYHTNKRIVSPNSRQVVRLGTGSLPFTQLCTSDGAIIQSALSDANAWFDAMSDFAMINISLEKCDPIFQDTLDDGFIRQLSLSARPGSLQGRDDAYAGNFFKSDERMGLRTSMGPLEERQDVAKGTFRGTFSTDGPLRPPNLNLPLSWGHMAPQRAQESYLNEMIERVLGLHSPQSSGQGGQLSQLPPTAPFSKSMIQLDESDEAVDMRLFYQHGDSQVPDMPMPVLYTSPTKNPDIILHQWHPHLPANAVGHRGVANDDNNTLEPKIIVVHSTPILVAINPFVMVSRTPPQAPTRGGGHAMLPTEREFRRLLRQHEARLREQLEMATGDISSIASQSAQPIATLLPHVHPAVRGAYLAAPLHAEHIDFGVVRVHQQDIAIRASHQQHIPVSMRQVLVSRHTPMDMRKYLPEASTTDPTDGSFPLLPQKSSTTTSTKSKKKLPKYDQVVLTSTTVRLYNPYRHAAMKLSDFSIIQSSDERLSLAAVNSYGRYVRAVVPVPSSSIASNASSTHTLVVAPGGYLDVNVEVVQLVCTTPPSTGKSTSADSYFESGQEGTVARTIRVIGEMMLNSTTSSKGGVSRQQHPTATKKSNQLEMHVSLTYTAATYFHLDLKVVNTPATGHQDGNTVQFNWKDRVNTGSGSDVSRTFVRRQIIANVNSSTTIKLFPTAAALQHPSVPSPYFTALSELRGTRPNVDALADFFATGMGLSSSSSAFTVEDLDALLSDLVASQSTYPPSMLHDVDRSEPTSDERPSLLHPAFQFRMSSTHGSGQLVIPAGFSTAFPVGSVDFYPTLFVGAYQRIMSGVGMSPAAGSSGSTLRHSSLPRHRAHHDAIRDMYISADMGIVGPLNSKTAGTVHYIYTPAVSEDSLLIYHQHLLHQSGVLTPTSGSSSSSSSSGVLDSTTYEDETIASGPLSRLASVSHHLSMLGGGSSQNAARRSSSSPSRTTLHHHLQGLDCLTSSCSPYLQSAALLATDAGETILGSGLSTPQVQLITPYDEDVFDRSAVPSSQLRGAAQLQSRDMYAQALHRQDTHFLQSESTGPIGTDGIRTGPIILDLAAQVSSVRASRQNIVSEEDVSRFELISSREVDLFERRLQQSLVVENGLLTTHLPGTAPLELIGECGMPSFLSTPQIDFGVVMLDATGGRAAQGVSAGMVYVPVTNAEDQPVRVQLLLLSNVVTDPSYDLIPVSLKNTLARGLRRTRENPSSGSFSAEEEAAWTKPSPAFRLPKVGAGITSAVIPPRTSVLLGPVRYDPPDALRRIRDMERRRANGDFSPPPPDYNVLLLRNNNSGFDMAVLVAQAGRPEVSVEASLGVPHPMDADVVELIATSSSDDACWSNCVDRTTGLVRPNSTTHSLATLANSALSPTALVHMYIYRSEIAPFLPFSLTAPFTTTSAIIAASSRTSATNSSSQGASSSAATALDEKALWRVLHRGQGSVVGSSTIPAPPLSTAHHDHDPTLVDLQMMWTRLHTIGAILASEAESVAASEGYTQYQHKAFQKSAISTKKLAALGRTETVLSWYVQQVAMSLSHEFRNVPGMANTISTALQWVIHQERHMSAGSFAMLPVGMFPPTDLFSTASLAAESECSEHTSSLTLQAGLFCAVNRLRSRRGFVNTSAMPTTTPSADAASIASSNEEACAAWHKDYLRTNGKSLHFNPATVQGERLALVHKYAITVAEPTLAAAKYLLLDPSVFGVTMPSSLVQPHPDVLRTIHSQTPRGGSFPVADLTTFTLDSLLHTPAVNGVIPTAVPSPILSVQPLGWSRTISLRNGAMQPLYVYNLTAGGAKMSARRRREVTASIMLLDANHDIHQTLMPTSAQNQQHTDQTLEQQQQHQAQLIVDQHRACSALYRSVKSRMPSSSSDPYDHQYDDEWWATAMSLPTTTLMDIFDASKNNRVSLPLSVDGRQYNNLRMGALRRTTRYVQNLQAQGVPHVYGVATGPLVFGDAHFDSVRPLYKDNPTLASTQQDERSHQHQCFTSGISAAFPLSARFILDPAVLRSPSSSQHIGKDGLSSLVRGLLKDVLRGGGKDSINAPCGKHHGHDETSSWPIGSSMTGSALPARRALTLSPMFSTCNTTTVSSSSSSLRSQEELADTIVNTLHSLLLHIAAARMSSIITKSAELMTSLDAAEVAVSHLLDEATTVHNYVQTERLRTLHNFCDFGVVAHRFPLLEQFEATTHAHSDLRTTSVVRDALTTGDVPDSHIAVVINDFHHSRVMAARYDKPILVIPPRGAVDVILQAFVGDLMTHLPPVSVTTLSFRSMSATTAPSPSTLHSHTSSSPLQESVFNMAFHLDLPNAPLEETAVDTSELLGYIGALHLPSELLSSSTTTTVTSVDAATSSSSSVAPIETIRSLFTKIQGRTSPMLTLPTRHQSRFEAMVHTLIVTLGSLVTLYMLVWVLVRVHFSPGATYPIPEDLAHLISTQGRRRRVSGSNAAAGASSSASRGPTYIGDDPTTGAPIYITDDETDQFLRQLLGVSYRKYIDPTTGAIPPNILRKLKKKQMKVLQQRQEEEAATAASATASATATRTTSATTPKASTIPATAATTTTSTTPNSATKRGSKGAAKKNKASGSTTPVTASVPSFAAVPTPSTPNKHLDDDNDAADSKLIETEATVAPEDVNVEPTTTTVISAPKEVVDVVVSPSHDTVVPEVSTTDNIVVVDDPITTATTTTPATEDMPASQGVIKETEPTPTTTTTTNHTTTPDRPIKKDYSSHHKPNEPVTTTPSTTTTIIPTTPQKDTTTHEPKGKKANKKDPTSPAPSSSSQPTVTTPATAPPKAVPTTPTIPSAATAPDTAPRLTKRQRKLLLQQEQADLYSQRCEREAASAAAAVTTSPKKAKSAAVPTTTPTPPSAVWGKTPKVPMVPSVEDPLLPTLPTLTGKTAKAKGGNNNAAKTAASPSALPPIAPSKSSPLPVAPLAVGEDDDDENASSSYTASGTTTTTAHSGGMFSSGTSLRGTASLSTSANNASSSVRPIAPMSVDEEDKDEEEGLPSLPNAIMSSPTLRPLERFAQQLDILRRNTYGKFPATPQLGTSSSSPPDSLDADSGHAAMFGIMNRVSEVPPPPLSSHLPTTNITPANSLPSTTRREASLVIEVDAANTMMTSSSPAGTLQRLPTSSTIGSNAGGGTLGRGEVYDSKRASHQPASNAGTIGNAGSTHVSRAGFEQYQRDRMAQEQQRGGRPPTAAEVVGGGGARARSSSAAPGVSSIGSAASDDIRFSFTDSLGARSSFDGGDRPRSPSASVRGDDPQLNLLLSALQNISDAEDSDGNESSSSLPSSDSSGFELLHGRPLSWSGRNNTSGLNFALAPGDEGDSYDRFADSSDEMGSSGSSSFHASVTDQPFNPSPYLHVGAPSPRGGNGRGGARGGRNHPTSFGGL